MNWSNPLTWASGVVPVAGDSVVITNVMSVWLDVSPPPLKLLTVEGQLWFQDGNNLVLTSDGIVVFGDMQVDHGSCPCCSVARRGGGAVPGYMGLLFS